jgi:hypothetical protein
MRKEKIYEYVWYKNKIKWTPRFSKVHKEFQKFQDLRSELIFPTMCNAIWRTLRLEITLCHLHMSTNVKVYLFSLPLLDIMLFSNDLFDDSQ